MVTSVGHGTNFNIDQCGVCKGIWFDKNEWEKAAAIQQRITAFRDEMLKLDVLPAFSYGMNLLGYDGNFAPDYCKLEKGKKEMVYKLMKEYKLKKEIVLCKKK